MIPVTDIDVTVSEESLVSQVGRKKTKKAGNSEDLECHELFALTLCEKITKTYFYKLYNYIGVL